jgi:hypothetical protein
LHFSFDRHLFFHFCDAAEVILMTQNVAGENGLDLDLDPVTEQN